MKKDILTNIDLDNKGLMEYKLVHDKKEFKKSLLLSILITFILTFILTYIFMDIKHNSDVNVRFNQLNSKISSLEEKIPKENTEQAK